MTKYFHTELGSPDGWLKRYEKISIKTQFKNNVVRVQTEFDFLFKNATHYWVSRPHEIKWDYLQEWNKLLAGTYSIYSSTLIFPI